jgi:PHS family inorganic phosphate transporter-like MFS transporter
MYVVFHRVPLTTQLKRYGNSLEIFALFMLTGIGSTLLIPETKGKTLEELSNENQDGFVKAPAKKTEIRDGLIIQQ